MLQPRPCSLISGEVIFDPRRRVYPGVQAIGAGHRLVLTQEPCKRTCAGGRCSWTTHSSGVPGTRQPPAGSQRHGHARRTLLLAGLAGLHAPLCRLPDAAAARNRYAPPRTGGDLARAVRSVDQAPGVRTDQQFHLRRVLERLANRSTKSPRGPGCTAAYPAVARALVHSRARSSDDLRSLGAFAVLSLRRAPWPSRGARSQALMPSGTPSGLHRQVVYRCARGHGAGLVEPIAPSPCV